MGTDTEAADDAVQILRIIAGDMDGFAALCEHSMAARRKLKSSCEKAASEIAALRSRVAQLEGLKNKIDYRLNACLCEMKPNYDDSIAGFNEAWDIVHKAFAEVALSTPTTRAHRRRRRDDHTRANCSDLP